MFYHHKRIGKNGKSFYLLKFRSMAQGKDDNTYIQYLKELIESERPSNGIYPDNGNGHHPQGAINEDTETSTVSKDGCVIHELPGWDASCGNITWMNCHSFRNMLKGEMSLVGPRPHVQMEVDYYTSEQYRGFPFRRAPPAFGRLRGKLIAHSTS